MEHLIRSPVIIHRTYNSMSYYNIYHVIYIPTIMNAEDMFDDIWSFKMSVQISFFLILYIFLLLFFFFHFVCLFVFADFGIFPVNFTPGYKVLLCGWGTDEVVLKLSGRTGP